ncbi:MAG TPA: hypothetical protein IGS17_01865 [Oscillatoriales cyanobacterium M59_W2019_021]|nr:MAG: hypothetical protein D6728_07910 [Cyanobacteria bacterium J055]HIK32495.1 hypothetical protein [Oscillatoriales cyanobacterium M4454_W2019_049]HIK49661.1 hypothetical protein [Oscillatoriales cyanobacterium M59_W2019_021]
MEALLLVMTLFLGSQLIPEQKKEDKTQAEELNELKKFFEDDAYLYYKHKYPKLNDEEIKQKVLNAMKHVS